MSFVLGKKSVDILSNLSAIEENMLLVEGNQQATSSITKRIYATARLPDSFDSSFGMYDLNVLLGMFKLFSRNETFNVSYNPNNMTVDVFDDYGLVTVKTSDVSKITEPRIGVDIGEEDTDIVIDLTNSDLVKMVEFVKVTGTNIISFVKRDEDNFIRIEGYDENILNESLLKGVELEPTWFIRIGEEVNMESFIYYTKLNFKILDDDYEVRIRQYYGDRSKGDIDKYNKGRPNAIQIKGEYITYAVLYLPKSNNQQLLKTMGV